MSHEKIKGNAIMEGVAEGEVLYTEDSISFFGGVDMKTGQIIQKGHELKGRSIKDKVLIFPKGSGSTVGSYVIYGLKKYNSAPKAMILENAETIICTGAILAKIPCIDGINIKSLKNAEKVKVVVTTNDAYVEILR